MVPTLVMVTWVGVGMAVVHRTSPRCTDTPEKNVTTDHAMLMLEVSPVSRMKSIVLHGFAHPIRMFPRKRLPGGTFALDLAWKIRNDVDGSKLDAVVTVRVPLALLTAVPDCTLCATAPCADCAEMSHAIPANARSDFGCFWLLMIFRQAKGKTPALSGESHKTCTGKVLQLHFSFCGCAGQAFM
jgi:hypothetical protein